MSNLTPGKPVVAVALDRPGGYAALRRATASGLDVVALAERGLSMPPGTSETVEVPRHRATVGTAIREASARDTAWVVVPRTMGTAQYLISAGLRSVGKHVDGDHPGIAMLVVSPDRDPEVSYRRALAMVDLGGRAASGVAALAAVELCVHSGASLDVMVLGLGEQQRPATTQHWAALLPVARRHELFRRAVELAQESNLSITWLAADDGDNAVDTVSAQVEREDYDVVIDAASGHRLRRHVGARRSIRRLVDDHAHRRVAWHLLQHSTCDVLVVMDAIELGMLPAAAVRSGAAAALALGMVSVASPAAAQAPMPAVVQASAVASVTPEAVAQARRRAVEARDNVTLAEQAVAAAEARVQAESDEAGLAREAVVRMRGNAEPAAAELARARRDLGMAERERLRAEEQLVQAQGRSSSPPAAEAAAQAAAAASSAARSSEAAAYEEYLVFAAEVSEAEAELLAAVDDVTRARAELRAAHEQAAAAESRAKSLDAEVRALDEALHAGGLHPPAIGRVTSGFGPRVHPVTGVHKLHTGTDFTGDDGTYYAAASGVVTYAGFDGAYGYMVKIDHGTIAGPPMETWYAHQPGLDVSVGQHVERGQVIGRIGNTGYSTGPHAHVELRVNGKPVDLMPYLEDAK